VGVKSNHGGVASWWQAALSAPPLAAHQLQLMHEPIRHHICITPLPPTRNAPQGSQALVDALAMEAHALE
jgi:hypothetical protein